MKLPEIELTPEQNEDRTIMQLLFASDQALKGLTGLRDQDRPGG
jgi:hypothetical protein